MAQLNKKPSYCCKFAGMADSWRQINLLGVRVPSRAGRAAADENLSARRRLQNNRCAADSRISLA